MNSFLVALLHMNIDLDFGTPQGQEEAVEAMKVRFIVKAVDYGAPCTPMQPCAHFKLPSHVSPAFTYTLLGTSYDGTPPSPKAP